MPWSEWIQSPEESAPRSPLRTASTGSDGLSVPITSPGDAEAQISEANSEALAGLGAITEMIPDSVDDASALQQWHPTTIGSPDAIAEARLIWAIHWYGFAEGTTRQMFPPEMSGLEYGVDYGPRPDRDEMEDLDAYIEYEDGLIELQMSDVQGWDGEIELTVAEASKDGDPWTSASGRASLRDDLGSRPDEFPPAVLASAIFPGMGGGTTVAEVSGPTGTSASDTFSFGATTPGFTLVVEPDLTFPHDDGLYSGVISNARSVYARLLYPQYRYWIPGGRLPLQQKQRSDGLALRGAPSWRRRQSRQATNRWRANL